MRELHGTGVIGSVLPLSSKVLHRRSDNRQRAACDDLAILIGRGASQTHAAARQHLRRRGRDNRGA